MKLPDGRIVSPAYQKTYYQADDVAHNPVQPFPAGLELLAGDHHGSTPPKQINFFCAGGNGYFNNMGRICGPRSPGGFPGENPDGEYEYRLGFPGPEKPRHP